MIEKYFEEITDKRQQRRIKRNLLAVVAVTICAVIAGCEVWEDIDDYCRVKETWFRESPDMARIEVFQMNVNEKVVRNEI